MSGEVLTMTGKPNQHESVRKSSGERGTALATAIFLMAILAAIAMSVLAVVNTESRIAGSDLQRTQTFYAGAAGIEKMTADFSGLFSRTSRPSAAQLTTIANSAPPELVTEGFTITQSIDLDDTTLNAMRLSQGLPSTAYPQVTIPSGPFAGLSAAVAPWDLDTIATSRTGAQVHLTRKMNNYLIPIFQFGMFSYEDIEVHPGPEFYFNGRVHANGNLYLNGNMKFLDKVTTANEVVYDVMRNGETFDRNDLRFQSSPIEVVMTRGSVFNGPNLPGATPGQRGYFPGSPSGTINANWASTSTAAPQIGVNNQFGGQVQTRVTGISPLMLPMQLDGNATREIIKRRMPNDNQTLSESRYHSKAQIRILIDDESGAGASGIPAGRGVLLSQFNPIPLPVGATSGKALWRVSDAGVYTDTSLTAVKQGTSTGPLSDTVRGVKGVSANSANGVKIPAGAGITGKILIEIVAANGTAYDVTAQVLSMGMTVGEPNAIINIQRPLWAAFTQGTRDRDGGTNYLTYILDNYWGADGEINVATGIPTQDGDGYLENIQNDSSGQQVRSDTPASAGNWNSIVPINIYNVREGRINTSLDKNDIYERGMMSVVDINMRNLARWVDGVYNTNLLSGSNAVSTNIDGNNGYIVYFSDRRGDRVKSERDSSGVTLSTTNGMVDNEDIYGPNNLLDPGEDVIDALADGSGVLKRGTLQKDTNELPDPSVLPGAYGGDDNLRAKIAAAWLNPSNYFRRSVRLFNGENLQISGAANKLSSTKGLTIASENMLYTWGNYNTTGINGQPAGAATLNDSSQTYYYLGNQVPSSIVCDAWFPLSRVWFDSTSTIHPEDDAKRQGDIGADLSQETSIRVGVIAGNNLSALAGSPDAGNSNSGESRLNGGMHNFPRFLEGWQDRRMNFVGSLIPLFHSTQALGPFNVDSSIYTPPTRNWSFDATYRDPNRLPPGTPQFQYIEPTAFRQVF